MQRLPWLEQVTSSSLGENEVLCGVLVLWSMGARSPFVVRKQSAAQERWQTGPDFEVTSTRCLLGEKEQLATARPVVDEGSTCLFGFVVVQSRWTTPSFLSAAQRLLLVTEWTLWMARPTFCSWVTLVHLPRVRMTFVLSSVVVRSATNDVPNANLAPNASYPETAVELSVCDEP